MAGRRKRFYACCTSLRPSAQVCVCVCVCLWVCGCVCGRVGEGLIENAQHATEEEERGRGGGRRRSAREHGVQVSTR